MPRPPITCNTTTPKDRIRLLARLAPQASAVSNWWNGLSPTDRTIIVIVATVALTVATDGVVAPLAADAIGTEVGADVAVDVAANAAADAGADSVGTAVTDAATTGMSHAELDSLGVSL